MENWSLIQWLGEVRADAEEAHTADEKVCDVYDDGWARFANDIKPLIQESSAKKLTRRGDTLWNERRG